MKRNVNYKPPFVYFGGKSPVANIVWDALGDPYNYVEPFCGSAAVLFLRPHTKGRKAIMNRVETINDADGFISNAWRAIQSDPEAVAEFADCIVSETDLHARHLWLIGQRESLTDRLCGDPDFYDARAAGYWIWGMNCWIGSGWCSGSGPWTSEDGLMVLRNSGQGVNRQLPHLRNSGQGVNRQLPHLGNSGQGVNRQLPHLGNPGQGVNRKRLEVAATPAPGRPGAGRQPETQDELTDRRAWLVEYLRSFASRLRGVRICCGDWQRVCGPSVTYRHGLTGVFLDPPYADSANRTAKLYATDCEQVAHRAREWAIAEGGNPLMRIVLAGYDGEHEMPSDWRVQEWQAAGGYGLQGDEEGTGRANRKKERLWCSPHCLKPLQGSLFSKATQ